MQTEIALLKQSMSNIADDIAFIRSGMEDVSKMLTSLTRIEEKQLNQSAAVGRAFAAIEKDRKEIDELRKELVAEREKTNKWINMGIGAWAVASVVWVLFGGIVAWWVSKVTEQTITKVSSLFSATFG